MSGPLTPHLCIAAAQTASVVGDLVANVGRAVAVATEAASAGATMVVFPELSLVGYDLTRLHDDRLWLTDRDPRLDPLRRCAEEHEITIAVGAPALRPDGRRWLATIVLGPHGVELVHGKQFVHGPERGVFDDAPPATSTLDVAGWRVALAVCFDVAVPVHAASAAALGADVYVGSALYVEGEERRVDIHFAARAMDHRMFAVLVNHSGPSVLGPSIGGSGLWSPTGDRVRAAGLGEELVLLHLDAADLARFRPPPTG